MEALHTGDPREQYIYELRKCSVPLILTKLAMRNINMIPPHMHETAYKAPSWRLCGHDLVGCVLSPTFPFYLWFPAALSSFAAPPGSASSQAHTSGTYMDWNFWSPESNLSSLWMNFLIDFVSMTESWLIQLPRKVY